MYTIHACGTRLCKVTCQSNFTIVQHSSYESTSIVKKSIPICTEMPMRGLEEVALSFYNDLFDHMITFHQEVTISCDIGCLEGMQQVQPKMCLLVYEGFVCAES